MSCFVVARVGWKWLTRLYTFVFIFIIKQVEVKGIERRRIVAALNKKEMFKFVSEKSNHRLCKGKKRGGKKFSPLNYKKNKLKSSGRKVSPRALSN